MPQFSRPTPQGKLFKDFLPNSQSPTRIRYGLYQPSATPLAKCIVYLNGRTEWIDKIEELPTWLDLPDGCGFLTLDHRGQGASFGKRAYVDNYEDYVDDLQTVISGMIPNLPYVIMSHSMGGLIALLGTLQGKLNPRRMALFSPLLGMPRLPIPDGAVRLLASAACALGFGEAHTGGGRYEQHIFQRNKLTHSEPMFRRVQTSPFPIGSATYGWVRATYKAIDYVWAEENLRRLSVPTLIVCPTEERVVDRDAGRKFIDRCRQLHPSLELDHRAIEGARHELFMEIDEYRNTSVELARQWFKDFLK